MSCSSGLCYIEREANTTTRNRHDVENLQKRRPLSDQKKFAWEHQQAPWGATWQTACEWTSEASPGMRQQIQAWCKEQRLLHIISRAGIQRHLCHAGLCLSLLHRFLLLAQDHLHMAWAVPWCEFPWHQEYGKFAVLKSAKHCGWARYEPLPNWEPCM